MFKYNYILIISLIIISLITWIEFNGIFYKLFKNNIIKFLLKLLSLFYLSSVVYIISLTLINDNIPDIWILYPLLISISSDIGGLFFGKIFKGKKLTKISPNKTVSGSIGSFIFSLSLIPIFLNQLLDYSLLTIIFITIFISLTSQLGDLLISFLKRKTKIKNTGDILPGHGGFLDRVDGIIFALPIGFILFLIN
jgi:phosphatidate cytidylyltransferase